ncbi:hypothetical protein G4G28_10245 [Massilia sp. Dwa41.01b]|uniref:trypsin-like serine peptidase n=1 Tax=unclassified Massilia TaxID=2609279 RepID=UPI0016030253|nr:MULTISPECIES: serine protease [unclassified Massilia]QNA88781.1 hypothetical protein G4G28_10245 [Massilia sp. Dwa41.01b]QNA99682.1 hypothetical protein G4G31_13935 [Massilia sp. Se16.2.3]
MKRTLAALLCLFMLASTVTTASGREPSFEQRHPLGLTATYSDYGGTVWWRSAPIKANDASFIRLKFTSLRNPRKETAFIVVRDEAGNELQRLSLLDVDPERPLVTMRFQASEVSAYVEAPARPRALRLTLSDYFTDSGRDPRPLSIGAVDQPWASIADLDKAAPAQQRARGVVKLLFTSDMSSCTGFLVAPGKIMTNHHCIEASSAFSRSGKSCADVDILLDYLSDTRPPVTLRCLDAKTYKTPDITVLRVAPADLPLLAGRPVARFADVNAALPVKVELIHHPGGLPMMLSRDCQAVDNKATAANLRHTCHTAGGSSGSPLFDASGRVVGVQVKGFPNITMSEYTRRLTAGEKFYNTAVDVKRMQQVLEELDK